MASYSFYQSPVTILVVDNSARKEGQKAQSPAGNSTAVDLTNNPAAATIASDTGEVPSNVTTKLGTYQKRRVSFLLIRTTSSFTCSTLFFIALR